MNPNDIVPLVAIIGLIVIPSLGLTARFALKPIIEGMLKIREALDRQRSPVEDPRLATIEARLSGLEEAVERIAVAAEFDTRLRAAAEPARLSAADTAAGPRDPAVASANASV
jgi:hypothetical protein